MSSNTKTTPAWTFSSGGFPACVEKTSLPLPSGPPGAKQLYVRVKAAALNPVDIQIMNLPWWGVTPTALAPAKKGLGADFAGVVEEAGSESGFKKGDEVFGLIFSITTGVLQETAVIDLAAAAVTLKPSSWSWSKAASLALVWLTAQTSIHEVEAWMPQQLASSPPPGATPPRLVVLGGSSSTGIYTLMLAKKRNWKVLTTCSERNAAYVHNELGADEVVDYNKESVAERVRAFKPDTIIDCVGGTECIGLAKRYVTIVGDKTSRASIGGPSAYATHPRMVIRALLSKIGVVNSYACIELNLNKQWLDESLSLNPATIAVDSEFAFDDVAKAYERLNTGRARGKVVVKMSE